MSQTLTDRTTTDTRGRLIEFPVGSRFLGVKEVCAEFGVSTATAVRALNRLADEGLLRAQHGVGYFVVAHPAEGESDLWANVDVKLQSLESAITEMRAAIDRLREER